jgi:hypothetical protein
MDGGGLSNCWWQLELRLIEARLSQVQWKSPWEAFEILRQKNRAGVVDHSGFCSDTCFPVRGLARDHYVPLRDFFRIHS